MTRSEQRWLRRGISILLVLAFALFAVTTFSVVQTANDRAAAADRAERTAAELHVLASRLDRQAAVLDRQAAALETQADRADRSRAQFRKAAQEILERLGSDLDAFAESGTHPAPSSGSTSGPDRDVATGTKPKPEPVHPGCVNGTGPKKCRDTP